MSVPAWKKSQLPQSKPQPLRKDAALTPEQGKQLTELLQQTSKVHKRL
ncbi:MAG: hypothetical protein WAN35_10895 [Terracidiphilus sp.]